MQRQGAMKNLLSGSDAGVSQNSLRGDEALVSVSPKKTLQAVFTAATSSTAARLAALDAEIAVTALPVRFCVHIPMLVHAYKSVWRTGAGGCRRRGRELRRW